MGYKVSSFLSVSSADGHEHFFYYLPAQGMASLWLNHWINSNFDRLASKFGPKAILITSPEGGEDEFLRSAREAEQVLGESLRSAGNWDAEKILHEGSPMLIVSRQPLRVDDPEDRVECAVVNLAAYDQDGLAKLFDQLIQAVQKPNVFGVGVNGNAVVQMLKAWRKRRSRPGK